MTCPRCGEAVEEDALYGPCDSCRNQLRGMLLPEPDERFGPNRAILYGEDETRPVPKAES